MHFSRQGLFTFGAAAVVMLAGGTVQAASVTVDQFVPENSGGEQVVSGTAGNAVWEQFNPSSGVLGDYRDLGVKKTDGPGFSDISNAVYDGTLLISADSQVSGSAWVQWDGDDSGSISSIAERGLATSPGDGNPGDGADLRDGTNTGLNITVDANDKPDADLTFEMWTGESSANTAANSYTLGKTLPEVAPAAPAEQVFFSFDDFMQASGTGSADFTDVGAIEAQFTDLPESLDVTIGVVSTFVPSPSAFSGGALLLAFGLWQGRRRRAA